jgi:hypothetical protein
MAAKKAPVTRKPKARPAATQAEVRATPDELRRLISEAAYYRAKRRGFEPGHELDDWIQAEAEVMGRVRSDH